ncbi:uncharacterized protein LOC113311710 [Papaver somniferum]|uniref:uncharacterized protein LOC113311710 n=1 Tax=Papaver somniferum TaxID=3469 RepID=UPI000E6F5307|nr:uncharacterized protein LOC113311710 [Papaver somniferum]
MEMRTYYTNLFAEQNDFSFTLDNLDFPCLNDVEKEFSEEEVYAVIKHFGINKSSVPDGFSMEFYKNCWHIIKKDFMKLMEEFYRYGSLDWRLNFSFLSLIPKKEDSCAPKDFRPLSLLGGAYKILSKVLANRLKTVMPKLEMDFFNFSTNVSVLVNGSSTEKFKPSKGLRQVEEMRKLLIILNIFEMLTRMKLNLEKSSLISVGADEIIQELAMELGYIAEQLPIKYLGFPLGATSRNVSIWEEVVQRMQEKLATWKKKYLNKAGRLVLIRSCLASLPI